MLASLGIGIAVLSFVVAIASTLLLWGQTRATVRQAEITTDLAGVEGLAQAIDRLHNVLGAFVEHPELRKHFYGGAPAPAEAEDLERAATIAEMLADVLASAISSATHLSPFTPHLVGWQDYAEYLLSNSPLLRDTVQAQPSWWPELQPHL